MEAVGQSAVSAPMPAYRSHKKVWALKIASVEDLGTDTTTDENPIVRVHFVDPSFAPREFNLHGKPTPEAGWYMVQYEGGYISFSPEKAFEEGNKLIATDFRQRVRNELEELEEKRHKLAAFVHGPNPIPFLSLGKDEQFRLKMQLAAMSQYAAILRERIFYFNQ